MKSSKFGLGRLAKQHASRFFCTFLFSLRKQPFLLAPRRCERFAAGGLISFPPLHDCDENCLIPRFVEDVNTRQQFSFPGFRYSPFEFKFRWNKRDKDRSSANSPLHAKRRLCSRRRRCCLIRDLKIRGRRQQRKTSPKK